MKINIPCLCLLSILLNYGSIKAQSNLYFPPNSTEWATTDPSSLGWDISRLDDLKSFLDANNSRSFILLKDGKIVLEYYFKDHDVNKVWYWASAGKSLTSILAAFAQADGKLDLEKPSSTYLGKGWSSCSEAQELDILVRHHLTMTTGLDEAVNSDCTDKECLKYKAKPGTRWSYHNAPYTLMDGIITGATGQNLNTYFKNKLGEKIGMTGLFVKSDFNNVFYSTTRNMAKYGLFVLAKGKWNGTTVLDNAQYIEKMSMSSQLINPSYGYLWWLNGKDKFMLPSSQFVFNGPLIPTAPSDMFSALGKNDQKIHIVPSSNIVVIRMGDAAGDGSSSVPITFDIELWEKLNKIMKLGSATNEVPSKYSKEKIAYCFWNKIFIKEEIDIDETEIMDCNGKHVLKSRNEHQINVSTFSKGVYFVRVRNKKGTYYINKVFVN